MTLFYTGLVIFFAVHLVPVARNLRGSLIGAMGEKGYKMAFSLLSLVGITLLFMGRSRFPYTPLYDPPVWGRHLLMLLMMPAFILFVAANLNGHIKALLKHPMLLGTLIWSGGHLLANGDMSSVLLFGAFAVYAVVDLISASSRTTDGGPSTQRPSPAFRNDLVAVVIGLGLYALMFYLHGKWFVPLA